MPEPEFTGYIVLAIAANDDDTPKRDPARVIEELLPSLRMYDIVEARAVASNGQGGYYPYGPGYVA